MTTILKAVEFDEGLLDLVAGFDCALGAAAEFWEQEVNEWIRTEESKGDGALYWMGKGTKVWLYANADDEVIGYGSLCQSKWPDPSAEGWHKKLPRKPISLIPAVGIDQRFQGGPRGADKDERYSTKIIRHLIHQAAACADRMPFLGLYVHPDNARAIKFYSSLGFRWLDGQVTKNPAAGVDYRAMVLKIA